MGHRCFDVLSSAVHESHFIYAAKAACRSDFSRDLLCMRRQESFLTAYFVTAHGVCLRLMSPIFYLHTAHGAAPPLKMYAIKYTASEISTMLSQLASPASNGAGAEPPEKI